MSKKLLAAALAAAFLASGGMAKAADTDYYFTENTAQDGNSWWTNTGTPNDEGATLGNISVSADDHGLYIGTSTNGGPVATATTGGTVAVSGGSLTVGASTVGGSDTAGTGTINTNALTVTGGTLGTVVDNTLNSTGNSSFTTGGTINNNGVIRVVNVTADGRTNITGTAIAVSGDFTNTGTHNATDLMGGDYAIGGNIDNSSGTINENGVSDTNLGLMIGKVVTGNTAVGDINLNQNYTTSAAKDAINQLSTATTGEITLANQTTAWTAVTVGGANLTVNGGDLGAITAAKTTFSGTASTVTNADSVSGDYVSNNGINTVDGNVGGSVTVTNGHTTITGNVLNGAPADDPAVAISGGRTEIQGTVNGNVQVSGDSINTFGAINGSFTVDTAASNNTIKDAVTGPATINLGTTTLEENGSFGGALNVGTAATVVNAKGENGALVLNNVANSGTITNNEDGVITFGSGAVYTGTAGSVINNLGTANVDVRSTDSTKDHGILADIVEGNSGNVNNLVLSSGGTTVNKEIDLSDATGGEVDTTNFNGTGTAGAILTGDANLTVGGGNYQGDITTNNLTTGGEGVNTTLSGALELTSADGKITVADGTLLGGASKTVLNPTDMEGVKAIDIGVTDGTYSTLELGAGGTDLENIAVANKGGVLDVNSLAATLGTYVGTGNDRINNNKDATSGITTTAATTAEAGNLSGIVDGLIAGTGNGSGAAGEIGTLTVNGQIATDSIDWSDKDITDGTLKITTKQDDAGDIDVTKDVSIVANGGKFGAVTAEKFTTNGDLEIGYAWDTALDVDIAIADPNTGTVTITENGSIVQGATNDVTLTGADNKIVNQGDMNLSAAGQDLTFNGANTGIINDGGSIEFGAGSGINMNAADAYIDNADGAVTIAAGNNNNLQTLADLLTADSNVDGDVLGIGDVTINGDMQGTGFNASDATDGNVALLGTQTGNQAIDVGGASLLVNGQGSNMYGSISAGDVEFKGDHSVYNGTITATDGGILVDTAADGTVFTNAVTANGGDVTFNAEVRATDVIEVTGGDVNVNAGGDYASLKATADATGEGGDINATKGGTFGNIEAVGQLVGDEVLGGNITLAKGTGDTAEVTGSVTGASLNSTDMLYTQTGGNAGAPDIKVDDLTSTGDTFDGYVKATDKAVVTESTVSATGTLDVDGDLWLTESTIDGDLKIGGSLYSQKNVLDGNQTINGDLFTSDDTWTKALDTDELDVLGNAWVGYTKNPDTLEIIKTSDGSTFEVPVKIEDTLISVNGIYQGDVTTGIDPDDQSGITLIMSGGSVGGALTTNYGDAILGYEVAADGTTFSLGSPTTITGATVIGKNGEGDLLSYGMEYQNIVQVLNGGDLISNNDVFGGEVTVTGDALVGYGSGGVLGDLDDAGASVFTTLGVTGSLITQDSTYNGVVTVSGTGLADGEIGLLSNSDTFNNELDVNNGDMVVGYDAEGNIVNGSNSNFYGDVTVAQGDMISRMGTYGKLPDSSGGTASPITVTVREGKLDSTYDIFAGSVDVLDNDAEVFGSQFIGVDADDAFTVSGNLTSGGGSIFAGIDVLVGSATINNSVFYYADLESEGDVNITGDVFANKYSMMGSEGEITITGEGNRLLGGVMADGGATLKSGTTATIAGELGKFTVEKNAIYNAAEGDTIVTGEFRAADDSTINFGFLTDSSGVDTSTLARFKADGGTIDLGLHTSLTTDATEDVSMVVFDDTAVDALKIAGSKETSVLEKYLEDQGKSGIGGKDLFGLEDGQIVYNFMKTVDDEKALEDVLTDQGILGDRDMITADSLEGLKEAWETGRTITDAEMRELEKTDPQAAYALKLLAGAAGNDRWYDLKNNPRAAYAMHQWMNGKDWAGAVEAVTDTARNFNRAITSRAYNLGSLLDSVEYDECGNVIESCGGFKNRVWAGYTAMWGENSGRRYDRGYDYDAHGFNVGYDHVTSSGVGFGAAFGYSKGDYDNDGAFGGNNSKIHNYSFGLFASYNHAAGFFTTISGTYTRSKYKMSSGVVDASAFKNIADIGALSDRANYHGDTWSVGGKLGYDIAAMRNLTITPTLGLYYYHSNTNHFNTSMGRQGMKYSRHTLEMPVDVTVKYDIAVGCESTLSLIATGGYAYNFNNKGTKISNFNIAGIGTEVAGGRFVKPGSSSWNVGGGAQFRYRNFDVGVNYEYYGRRDYKSHSVNANVGVSF